MTEQETLGVLAYLKANYDNAFNRLTKADVDTKVKLWHRQFKDFEYEAVLSAIDCIISTDTSDFPPSIGKVKDMIYKLSSEDELTEIEAWNCVKKALRNSIYGAEEEFKKLPDIVQRLVGDPARLREWGTMDVDEVNTVVESNFMRSYRARAKADKEFSMIPQSVRLEFREKGLLSFGLDNGFKKIGSSND